VTLVGDKSAGAGGLHGFPPALTSYVGREAETTRVVALLGQSRLVTVTGPGGVGKTRLASEVARRVAGDFADGAWLAELAPVVDPALVPATVAAALGVQESGGQPASGLIAWALARQQVVLVLDNCEHLLGAVAELCRSLLAVADDLTVLTTSREPVGVAGETRYRLRPLPVGGADGSGGDTDAVRLFADRAQRVDPDFALDAPAEALTRRLVARLDGMPLAIELAAARVEALGLSQLLQKLESDSALLAGADRSLAERHQSMAATVEWSYRLLDELGRRVFRKLAVFPGPFTLDAAVAVAGETADLAVLQLVDCSLLMPPRTGPDARTRYLMLETLRAYGTERTIEAAEHHAAAAALARYAVQIAEEAAAGLDSGAGELAAARWLDAEDATLQVSLTWCLKHDLAEAARLAIALAPWWRLRGRAASGYELLSAATAHLRADDEAWCSAQLCLGDLATAANDLAAAFNHFTAARDLLAASPPSPALVRALNGQAASLANLGRLQEAAGDVGEALVLARQVADPTGEANALYWLAGLAYYSGDQVATLEWLQQTQLIDPAALPARTARICSLGLTIALTEAKDYGQARAICSEALAAARNAGDLLSQAECLAHLADIGLRTGDLDQVSLQLREALGLALRTGHQLMISDCLDYCGHLCAARQDWDEAITLWAALTANQQRSGLPDPPQDTDRRRAPAERAERALGTARTRAARERGSAMTLATAAELAVLQTARESSAGATASGAPRLSARERELITLIAQGNTDSQIASQLFISVSTVRSHLDRIRDKTSCRRRADLTRLALQVGLA
jgi:predicted ATPase/DNA-binding CsgD family transcriptional regulator